LEALAHRLGFALVFDEARCHRHDALSLAV
jgi:hypothetical protein